uniref:Uncharacterized protein n=1 Tax=Spongospora subterranea TaxID=70186 RepID=A0A0H5RCW8_9EUKA|eukprot:CRZ11818.1 hypothetical protein [Spongospora subterranea]
MGNGSSKYDLNVDIRLTRCEIGKGTFGQAGRAIALVVQPRTTAAEGGECGDTQDSIKLSVPLHSSLHVGPHHKYMMNFLFSPIDVHKCDERPLECTIRYSNLLRLRIHQICRGDCKERIPEVTRARTI